MVLTQASDAPLEGELHKREEWSDLVNIWDPSVRTFDLAESRHNWLLDEDSVAPAPSNLAVDLIYRTTLQGDVSVITVPEDRDNREPGFIGTNLLRFQRALATALSEQVVIETGDVSYHSRKLQDELQEGFRTDFAKVLPPHYDLALYSNQHGKAYAPAHITLIAWGTRGAARKEVTNYFFDVAGLHEDTDQRTPAGMSLKTLAPSIYCLERGHPIHESEGAAYRFPVEIPEGAITVFTNRGLAHGAQYATHAASRELNRKLTAQEQRTEPLNRDIMVPIDVLLL